MRAIRHGNLEKHGYARRIRAASNPAAVAAGHRIACLRALAGVTRRAMAFILLKLDYEVLDQIRQWID